MARPPTTAGSLTLSAAGIEDGHEAFDIESTLFVSRNVSFTISPKSLIIRGTYKIPISSNDVPADLIVASEGVKKSDKKSGKPAGAASRRSVTLDASAYSEPIGGSSTRALSLYNILWAELTEEDLIIYYAKEISKTAVQTTSLKYNVEERDHVEAWITKLLDRAYGKAQRQKRAKILINPKSGKGNAERIYTKDVLPILDAARCDIDMTVTKHRGEATEIAESLDIESYDMIVCLSGDGSAHEVFNGLGKRKDAKRALSKIAVVHVPCGSGNAMSCNMNGNLNSPSLAALRIIKGIRTPLDLVSITQGDKRYLSFLSQALGIVAEFDLGTEHLRWMGGTARFTYGFFVRAVQKKVYPCDLAVKVVEDDKEVIKERYREELVKKEIDEDSVRADFGKGEGLPALKFGTVNDSLPEGWEMVSNDKLSSLYCGNVSSPSPSLIASADICIDVLDGYRCELLRGRSPE